MIRDLETGLLSYFFIELRIYRLIQVEDPPAVITAEVIVIVLSALEPAYRTAEVQFRYLPRLMQNPEISIHRAFAYMWYDFPYLIIYLIGGGMRRSASQEIENGLSLLCISIHRLIENGS